MRKLLTRSIMVLVLIRLSAAEDIMNNVNASIQHPSFEARLSFGFNYDYLRDPTDVSFEYPKGFFGFNIPLQGTVNLKNYAGIISKGVDSILTDTTLFPNGDQFKPNASARQSPNFTIRVDVPMMGGVASFSNTQNFLLNYENILGNPNVLISPDSLTDGVSLLLRGTINVPVDLSLGWESMTFGYAYRLNDLFTFALNLHRHIFTFDLRAKIDADLLGKYKYTMNSSDDQSGFGNPSVDGVLDYSSDKMYGQAYGHYEAEVWSPTLGIKAWRFTLTSRFGINTHAHGRIYAKYSVPFLIDPETFQTKYDLNDENTINDPDFRQALSDQAADSVVYSTKKQKGSKCVESDLLWKMPTGLTFSFDIIPEKLKLSYTKTFGDIRLKLDRIAKEQHAIEPGSQRENSNDSITIDLGVNTDNIAMIECKLWNSFVNLGVFGMDLSYGDQKHLLSDKITQLRLGHSVMLPVLNFGSAIGSKLQLLLEFDVLPLPALKTGVNYYF